MVASDAAKIAEAACSRRYKVRHVSRRLRHRACYSPLLPDRPVHEGNCRGSLTHSGCNALHAACAHIANRKNPRKAGLQRVWCARQRPVRGIEIISRQICARLDESLLVACHTTEQPVRAWLRTGHDEYVANCTALDLARW